MMSALTAGCARLGIPTPRRAFNAHLRPRADAITQPLLRLHGGEPLHIHINVHDDYTVVSFAGELDLANCGATYATLAGLLNKAKPHLVLDLRGVTFTDAAGLASLWQVPGLAERSGGWVRLAHVPFCVQRIIDILGHTFPQKLSIYETVSDAVADTQFTA